MMAKLDQYSSEMRKLMAESQAGVMKGVEDWEIEKGEVRVWGAGWKASYH